MFLNWISFFLKFFLKIIIIGKILKNQLFFKFITLIDF